MADWTAITGIMVSGVVGPVAGAGGAYFVLRRQQAHSDRTEAGVLLDDGAVALSRAAKVMMSRAVLIKRDENVSDQLMAQYNGDGRTVEELAVRIGLRLGDTLASRAYVDARESLRAFDDSINTFAQRGTDWAEVVAADNAVAAAQNEFLRAANAAVGLTIG